MVALYFSHNNIWAFDEFKKSINTTNDQENVTVPETLVHDYTNDTEAVNLSRDNADTATDQQCVSQSTKTTVVAPSNTQSMSVYFKKPIKYRLFKTELCKYFRDFGWCHYGDKCQFAHGAQELRTLTKHPKYKTERCKIFARGVCPYGHRCRFRHD